jgi:hypothetical protein
MCGVCVLLCAFFNVQLSIRACKCRNIQISHQSAAFDLPVQFVKRDALSPLLSEMVRRGVCSVLTQQCAYAPPRNAWLLYEQHQLSRLQYLFFFCSTIPTREFLCKLIQIRYPLSHV